MKKQKKWKPGGRSRQKTRTKELLLKRNEGTCDKDTEEPMLPLIVPRSRKKEE